MAGMLSKLAGYACGSGELRKHQRSGTECALLREHLRDLPAKQTVAWQGRTYACLPFADPHGQCYWHDVNEWHTVPIGWRVAAASDDVLANVVQQYGWSADFVIAAKDGGYQCVSTKNSPRDPLDPEGRPAPRASGDTLQLLHPGGRILLEREPEPVRCATQLSVE